MTREFLVDINPNMELPKYELILYSLTGSPITSLKNITNFNYKAFFIGIDEISFNIPAYRSENDGRKVKNEIYDLVDGEYYILLNDKKYFIIDEINEKADDDGNIYKEVHAYSREYELSQKKLVDYKADSRVLYDPSNTIDENGLEIGVLNYIFNHITKAWSIGNVDVDIILKKVHRALDFPNTNLIQVFQELQETFNCIFKFDTINQKIDIIEMDPSKIGQNQGLYISNGNFIKSLSKNIKYDEVKTRLYVYGKDNVSIQSISPTGQPFLDNFDAFKNTKFMTQGLIDALDAYQTKVENYNPKFESLLTQLQQANQVMEDLINADHPSDLNLKGLVALERALSIIQTKIDVKVEELAIIKKSIESATGTDLENMYADMRSIQSAIEMYNAEKDNINALIRNKRDEINNQQIIIDGIKQQISDLQYALDMNNPSNFTTEQLKELDKFIRVETYNDTNYTEHNITELYEEGKKILARISQPKIQFDVDVVDFLNVVECQHVWKKFVLGDIVTLEHRELGFDYEVRLVGYEHDYENNRLNLKFSNTYTFDDDTLWMRDLLEEINTTATAVDFNKYKWDKPDYLESKISKYIDTKLEEARQNILNAVGQRYLFDDSGLWLYKENPDGTLNPEQIRAINNTIALTKDNWNTVSTAITPQGVVAEQIYGKLGNFARVNAEQIIVDDWTGDPVENNFKDYVDQIKEDTNNINNTVNHIISDSFITNIEANSLKTSFENIKKEAQNIIAIADENGLLTSVERTNCYNALFGVNGLQPEINKWVGRNDYPVEITEDDRNNIINKFRILQDTMMALAEKIRYTREESLKNGIRTEFRAADGEIIGRVEQIDSRVTSAEQKITPTAIMQTVEQQVSQGNSIITTKSELQQTANDLILKFASNQQSIRYIKVAQKKSNVNNYCYWGELEVYANGENIALGKPVTANFTPTFGNLSYYTDGNRTNTIQYNNTSGNWAEVIVDLGSIRNDIDSIIEFKGSINANGREFVQKIEVSADGNKWFTVYDSDIHGKYVADRLNGKTFYLQGASAGIVKVNKDGIRVMHSGSNQYSEMRYNGFFRQWEYGEGVYLNDIYVAIFREYGDYLGNSGPIDPYRVYLPERFRGRNVEIIPIPLQFSVVIGRGRSDGTVTQLAIDNGIQCQVYINEDGTESKNLNAPTPWVDIDVFQVVWYNHSLAPSDGTIHFYGIDWMLIVIGK